MKKYLEFIKSIYISYIKSSVKRTSHYLDERRNLAYGVLTFDLVVAFFSIPLALYFKIGDEFFDYTQAYLLKMSFCFSLCSLTYFNILNTHQAMWRYMETGDILKHVSAITLAILTFAPLKRLLSQEEEMPQLILLIVWVIFLLATLTPRFFSYIHHHRRQSQIAKRPPLLILGTDDRTELFLKEISQSEDFPYTAHALISLRSDEVGLNIHGVPVVASVRDLAVWLKGQMQSQSQNQNQPPSKFFRLLISEQPGEYLSEILHVANENHVQLLRLPKSFTTLENLENAELKELSVESLFKDPLIGYTKEQKIHIKDKTILITGAGSYIFKPLIQSFLKLKAKKILLVDQSVDRLKKIAQLLDDQGHNRKSYALKVADINDQALMQHIIESEKPHIIIHTPLLSWPGEDNLLAYVRTNILATEFMAYLAHKYKVSQCLMLFEKPAEATPAIFEALIKGTFMRYLSEKETHYMIANVENIIGSSASISANLQKQINGGVHVMIDHDTAQTSLITAQQLGTLLCQMLADFKNDKGLLDYTLSTRQKVYVKDLAQYMLSLEKDDIMKKLPIISKGKKKNSETTTKLINTKNPYIFSSEYVAWTKIDHLESILKAADACHEKELLDLLKKQEKESLSKVA